MGQAKNRGSLEERKELARDRIDKATEEMTKNLQRLDELEKESEAIRVKSATSLINAFINHEEARRKARMGIRIGGNNHAS